MYMKTFLNSVVNRAITQLEETGAISPLKTEENQNSQTNLHGSTLPTFCAKDHIENDNGLQLVILPRNEQTQQVREYEEQLSISH